jgi:hypothetical protein
MAKKRAKKPATDATPSKKMPQFRTAVWEDKFIEALKNSNCVGYAANMAGIDRTTAYKHRQDNPAFVERWNDAKEMSVEEVEVTMRHRVMNGVSKGIYYQGKLIATEQVYNTALMCAWLNANCPEKYRQNYDLEKVVAALRKTETD